MDRGYSQPRLKKMQVDTDDIMKKDIDGLFSYNAGFYISDSINKEEIEHDGKKWPVKQIVHIPFSLMGTLAFLENYNEGEPIRYGTMFYFPVPGTNNIIKNERGDEGRLSKFPDGWRCWIS